MYSQEVRDKKRVGVRSILYTGRQTARVFRLCLQVYVCLKEKAGSSDTSSEKACDFFRVASLPKHVRILDIWAGSGGAKENFIALCLVAATRVARKEENIT